jgi:hypothetical protein
VDVALRLYMQHIPFRTARWEPSNVALLLLVSTRAALTAMLRERCTSTCVTSFFYGC